MALRVTFTFRSRLSALEWRPGFVARRNSDHLNRMVQTAQIHPFFFFQRMDTGHVVNDDCLTIALAEDVKLPFDS